MELVITTARLMLRHWKPEDLPAFQAMNRDPVVMEYFPSLLSAEESIRFHDRIQEHFADHGFGLYAVEEKGSGMFLGFTGFMVPSFTASFTPCVEIGWRFRKEYWGRGLATEAAAACLEYGFRKWDLTEVYSFTAVPNKRSENVMIRIGMQKVGVFNHPKLKIEDPLCPHLLYKAIKP